MKPLFSSGLKRPIDNSEIYEVLKSMRCEQNTEKLSKQWDLELRKKDPSFIRVTIKLYLFKVLTAGFLFSIAETLAR